MEFTPDRLKIHQVDGYWRVVMYIEGVKYLIDKENLQECFEVLHRDRLDPDFQQNLKEYRTSIGLK